MKAALESKGQKNVRDIDNIASWLVGYSSVVPNARKVSKAEFERC